MKIKDNCPECNPRSYTTSTMTHINKVEHEAYLYQCNDCNAKIWITKKPSTIKQRACFLFYSNFLTGLNQIIVFNTRV